MNYISSVPKLMGRENYDDWAFAIENFLILEGLSKCIEGTETDAEKISKAKAKLVLTLDTSLYVHVKEAKTAKELWGKLKDMYDDSGFSRRIGLIRALISYRLDNFNSMDAYVNQVVDTAYKLRRTGFTISEEWVGSLLLAGLPEKYGPMIMAIEHSGINISTDAIKTKLMDMVEDTSSKTGGAFATRKYSGKFKNPNFKNKLEKREIRCYKCKEIGHFMNQCPNSAHKPIDSSKIARNAFSAVFLTGQFKNTDSSSVTSRTWHRRFGHLNYNDLRIMKNGIVNGFNCNDKFDRMETCEVCCEGKMVRSSFKNKGNRATSSLQVVHADLCGPMERTSIGGSKYFLLFEDDYSRMCFVYFLKNKDEAIDRFKEFKELVENQQNKSIKIFRTDNGGEFCNGSFESLFEKSGIIHQKTNPYTPEQNGMLERMNRTIVEKARCLLFDANLGKEFWAEAVNTAVYLKNRSVANGLHETTPFELWTGKKPDVSSIRIFGSEVMMHIPKEKRLKFDRKAKKMILVGFGDSVKGYRLFDPVKRNVVTSRDVIITERTPDESKFHFWTDFADQDSTNSVGDVDVGSKNSVLSNIKNEEEKSSLKDTLPRRSERIKNSKKVDGYATYMCTSMQNEELMEEEDPKTLQEAVQRPEKRQWIEAVDEEYQSLMENDTWNLVELPPGKKPIECKWVFKTKRNADGTVIEVRHVSTTDMAADILTKGLNFHKHSKCCEKNETYFSINLSGGVEINVI